MQQRSLFPDGFEVQEQALAALRELSVAKALALVRRARAVDPSLVGSAALQRALEWLSPRLPDEPTVAAAAGVLADLPHAVDAMALDDDAAARVELGLAAYLAPRLPPTPGFLDAERTVPSPRIALLGGDARAARAGCEQLIGAGHADHAGLWFDHAHACWLAERRDEANASYVRALLLGPRDDHAWRCRCGPLQILWRRLAAPGVRVSNDLLLAEAWIAGVLRVPAGNTWLTAAQRRLVRELSQESSAWRFSLLVYLDRSVPAGDCDVDSREEMAVLMPDVFARYIAAIRQRQG